jgi:hypothetical protein
VVLDDHDVLARYLVGQGIILFSPNLCCDLGNSFSPVLAASFQNWRGVVVEITMTALLIGYFTAIAIVCLVSGRRKPRKGPNIVEGR